MKFVVDVYHNHFKTNLNSFLTAEICAQTLDSDINLKNKKILK